MRTLTFLAIVAPLLGIAAAAAQTPSATGELALRDECSFTPPGMNECLAAKVEASMVELRDARRFAIQRLDAGEEDGRYRRLAIWRLRAADASFERYRKAHCDFAASMGGGAIGHALNARRLACVADLNHRQAELLQRLVADRPPR